MHVQTELEGSILQCFTRSKLEKSEISTEEKTLLIPAPTFWTGFSTAIVYKITKNASSFLRKISFRVTIYLVDILILNYMIQELKWAKTQWTCPKITISGNKCRFKLSKLVKTFSGVIIQLCWNWTRWQVSSQPLYRQWNPEKCNQNPFNITRLWLLVNTEPSVGNEIKCRVKDWLMETWWIKNLKFWDDQNLALREKYPYSEFLRSVFSCIRTEYGDLPSKSPCSVRMRENVDLEKLQIRTLFTHCNPQILF